MILATKEHHRQINEVTHLLDIQRNLNLGHVFGDVGF